MAAQWEKDVFLATIDKFNNGGFGANSKDLVLSFMAERSVPDELTAEAGQQILVVVASYSAMFLYVAIAIGSFPSKIHSGFTIGIAGVLIVVASVVCSIGLISMLGFGLSLISSEVVPFLILAIGVDNMFILSNSLDRIRDEKSLEVQLGKALSSVGPSITSAAFCEILAFLTGILTKAPALVVFCLMAAFAVAFDYIFQITTFVGILSLNQQRKAGGNYDVVCCVKTEEPEEPRSPIIQSFVTNYFSKFVFHPFTKVLVAAVFIVLSYFSVIGCKELTLGLNPEVTAITNSNLFHYFKDESRYLEAGATAYIVLENINYTDDTDVGILTNLTDSLSAMNSSVEAPVYSWLGTFNQFINSGADWSDACNTTYIDDYSFQEKLQMFVQVKISSDCCQHYGICGEAWISDIAFAPDGNVSATRLRFSHTPLRNQSSYIDAFLTTRAVADYFQAFFVQNTSAPPKTAFAYSLFYVFFDQYIYIRGLALQNVILAVGVVFIAILLLRNLQAAFLVVMCVFGTSLHMIGIVYILNQVLGGYIIEINAVSVVNLVMATGLSVEFCTHIVLAYDKSTGTSKERAHNALSVMGSSILVGICTTKFVGVLVLGFARSTLFRLYYFRMYMALVVLGVFYGLIFLPIVLSLLPDQRPKVHASSEFSTSNKNSVQEGLLNASVEPSATDEAKAAKAAH